MKLGYQDSLGHVASAWLMYATGRRTVAAPVAEKEEAR